MQISGLKIFLVIIINQANIKMDLKYLRMKVNYIKFKFGFYHLDKRKTKFLQKYLQMIFLVLLLYLMQQIFKQEKILLNGKNLQMKQMYFQMVENCHVFQLRINVICLKTIKTVKKNYKNLLIVMILLGHFFLQPKQD